MLRNKVEEEGKGGGKGERGRERTGETESTVLVPWAGGRRGAPLLLLWSCFLGAWQGAWLHGTMPSLGAVHPAEGVI